MEKKNNKSDRNYRERVYRIVRRIPRGRVMTYGQIAYMLGEGYTPRTVGFVMVGSPPDLGPGLLPRPRVVKTGRKTTRGRPE